MDDSTTRNKASDDDITSVLFNLKQQDHYEHNSWSNGGSNSNNRCAFSSRVPPKSRCSSSGGNISSNVSEPIGFKFYLDENMKKDRS